MAKTKRVLPYLFSLISFFFIISFLIGTAAAEDNLTDTDASNWDVYTNQTIQEAINSASSGDTIVVNEGTYNENIQINKTNLTLISNGSVVINALDPNQPSVFIDSSGNYSKINGFTITSSSVAGIYLSHVSHSTISGNTISNNHYGIYLDSSSNNIISGNSITNTEGIYLDSSSNNTLSGNNITNNYYGGVLLVNSPENTLKNNLITDNAYNLDVTGDNISDYIQDIDTSNTIYGEPIYYLVGQNELVYDGISTGFLILILCNDIQIKNSIISSQVSLMNSTNVVIENCDLSGNEIHLVNSSYNTIKGVSTTRISFDSSHFNVISGNNISSGSNGISLTNSSNNSIIGNTISVYGGGEARASIDMDSSSNFNDFYIDNYYTGIYLESSSNNIILNNTVNYARVSGIYLYNSPNNTISSNLLLNSNYGIALYNSPNTSITENELDSNGFGIYMIESPGNVLRNNILTNNGYNFNILGDEISCYIQYIDTSNTINGNPIYYLINENGLTFDGTPIGFLALISCDNIQVRNVNLTENGIGILLINTTNSYIENNNITDNYEYGIKLWNSSNNAISTNNIINYDIGIYLESSSNNNISGNTINSGDYNYVEYLIFLNNSSNNEINGNNINGGLGLESSSENNISNNEALKIVLQLSPYNNISTNHASNIYLFSSPNINLSHNIISYNSSTGIYLESSSNCTILDNNITGDAKDTNNNYYYTIGILLENSSNNIISNNNLASYSRGIIIRNSNNNLITANNCISDLKSFNINFGISFYNSQSYGISLDEISSNNTISGNTLINHAYGIYFHLTSNNIVTDNIFDDNNIGILLEDSSKNTISNNIISNGTYGILTWYSGYDSPSGSNSNLISENNITNQSFAGIRIKSSSSNTIFNNNLSNNSQGYSTGIYLDTSSNNNTITGNIISGYDDGIYLSNSHENTISGNNQIQGSNNGIYLESSPNNTIYENNISNNVNGLQIHSSNVTINECVILNNATDIYLHNSSIYANKSTFDESKVTFVDSNSSLTTNWDFYIKVVDENGIPVRNVSVIVRKNDGTSLSLQNGTNDINNPFQYALTDTYGLVKVEDMKWYNHVLNAQNKNKFTPYSVTIIYGTQEYVIQNSVTQRCPGYIGPLLFVLPVNTTVDKKIENNLWISARGPEKIRPIRNTNYYIDIYNLGPWDSDLILINLDVDSIFKIIRVEAADGTVLWDANNIENRIPEIVSAFEEQYPEEFSNIPPDILNDYIRDYLQRNVVVLIKDLKVGEMEELKIILTGILALNNGELRFQVLDVPLTSMNNTENETSETSLTGTNSLVTNKMISPMLLNPFGPLIDFVFELLIHMVAEEEAKEYLGIFDQQCKDLIKKLRGEGGGYLNITILMSYDPNEKIGLSGHGAPNFIPYIPTIPYTIHFENIENATAAAQKIVITDYLDEDLDWDTFRFGEISLGNIIIPSWQSIVDLRPYKNLLVIISKKIDYTTGLVTWTFESIDPVTGLPPEDPLIGFLPPNQNPPDGEGWVSYLINPKLNIISGTEIRNKATIIFDNNPPIDTNEIINTIDSQPPISTINPLQTQNPSKFQVSWTGDDGLGSGILNYAIYYSENEGSYQLWLKTSETSATFTGTIGSTYKFFSIATDNVGNVENAPFTPDAITTINIITNQPPVANAGSNYTGDEGSTITLDASSSSDPDGDVLKYRWDFNNDGIWDTEWLDQPTTTYIWNDNYDGVVKLEVSDGELSNETTAQITINNVAPIVNAGQDQVVDEGETVNFNGSFTDHGINDTHNIKWDFGDGTIVTGSLKTTHRYVDNGIYNVTLTVTDKDNAVSTDNLTVTVNNVAPIVNAGVNRIITSGEKVELSGSYIDPGILDTFTVKWDFGDGSAPVFGTLNPSHKYYNKGNYTVTLSVLDKDGGVGMNTITITVNPITASVDIYPEKLNLKMCGQWITAIIKLPKTYDASKVKVNTIKLVYGGINIAASNVIIIKNTIVAIFDASKLTKLLKGKSNPITITINGKIKYNGGNAEFEGSDNIKIKKNYDPWSSNYWKKFLNFFNFRMKHTNFFKW